MTIDILRTRENDNRGASIVEQKQKGQPGAAMHFVYYLLFESLRSGELKIRRVFFRFENRSILTLRVIKGHRSRDRERSITSNECVEIFFSLFFLLKVMQDFLFRTETLSISRPRSTHSSYRALSLINLNVTFELAFSGAALNSFTHHASWKNDPSMLHNDRTTETQRSVALAR